MSKRSGDFVTLREVVDEVGADAVRFMMLYRKNDAVLDFDLAKVIEQSRDNAVFYVQYGHARGHSIFRNAREEFPRVPEEAARRGPPGWRTPILARLTDPAELGLLRRLALFPRLIEGAAEAHEPHRVAFYLYDLASEFHALWTKGRDSPHLRFIIQNDAEMTKARLALVQGGRVGYRYRSCDSGCPGAGRNAIIGEPSLWGDGLQRLDSSGPEDSVPSASAVRPT